MTYSKAYIQIMKRNDRHYLLITTFQPCAMKVARTVVRDNRFKIPFFIILKKFLKILLQAFRRYISNVSIIPLPIKSKIFTVIRSPFVNKKSREQFKLETFHRFILFKTSDIFSVSWILKKISFEGVGLKLSYIGR